MDTIKNLINAMSKYAEDSCLTDEEFIDALISCGVTKQDFIDCGYGDFIKEYFAN